mmetsp:Transcript_12451/g.30266  ORF Transcript_12451/g.30266 Transcript_12451/m.30266 type:complete len:229 (+) Transcript_12451:728-1414(+)
MASFSTRTFAVFPITQFVGYLLGDPKVIYLFAALLYRFFRMKHWNAFCTSSMQVAAGLPVQNPVSKYPFTSRDPRHSCALSHTPFTDQHNWKIPPCLNRMACPAEVSATLVLLPVFPSSLSMMVVEVRWKPPSPPPAHHTVGSTSHSSTVFAPSLHAVATVIPAEGVTVCFTNRIFMFVAVSAQSSPVFLISSRMPVIKAPAKRLVVPAVLVATAGPTVVPPLWSVKE